MRIFSLIGLFFVASLFSGCESQPVPVEQVPPLPDMALTLPFKAIEADDPFSLRLFFALEVENMPISGLYAKIASWRVEIDGEDATAAFQLRYPQGGFLFEPSNPLRLDMDIRALAAKGLAPKDNYSVTLITELEFDPSAVPQVSPPDMVLPRIDVRGIAAFPGVRPPLFSITEIAIIQAELINTRFRVGLRIDNPNPFPLELSSFSYSLYGNGRLWADGIERNVLTVNENSTLSGNIFLMMNFMGMSRILLDQIIHLQDVSYRFTGNVQVTTGIEYLPVFSDCFELSGFSKVLDR